MNETAKEVMSMFRELIEKAGMTAKERCEVVEAIAGLETRVKHYVSSVVDLEYMKRAELFGSRGRARWRGEPAPEGADWDFIVFTDDPVLCEQLRNSLAAIGEVKGSQVEFWVRAPCNVDLNVMPVKKRIALLEAYAHQDETGCSKSEMIDFLEKAWLAADISKRVKEGDLLDLLDVEE